MLRNADFDVKLLLQMVKQKQNPLNSLINIFMSRRVFVVVVMGPMSPFLSIS